MPRVQSNSLLEMGDIIKFNGLRGTRNLSETLRLKLNDIGVDGRITLVASEDSDTQWHPFDNNKVSYSDAIAMLNDNVWQLCE